MKKGEEREQKILDFITEQTRLQGYPPSVREICAAVGLKSTSSVHGYLKNLEQSGKIKYEPSKNRSVTVANSPATDNINAKIDEDMMPSEFLPVPVIGTVAAGMPILAEENVTDVMPMPMAFAKNRDVFMLKVQGESMINVGIFDGDYVIVEQRPDAINGQMVVALVDDSATVKTFYKENGHIRLQPENDSMEPIIVNEVTILGKVVGVFRML